MNHNFTLPPDYNTTEYAHLEILESGDVDIWLRRRGQFLIEKARETARECEAGKLSSLVVVGVSAVLSANPLMWIPLAIGAGGYLWTIFTEFQDTGAIKPIPLYRGRLGNLLGILEGQRGEQTHPLLEQIAYLSEQDKDEVLLLRYRFGQIAGVLGAVPPRTRFDLYRHLVEQYHARQILIERDEVDAYLASAVSEARRAMPAQDEPKPALPKKTEIEPQITQNSEDLGQEFLSDWQKPITPDSIPQSLISLGLAERAIAIIDALSASGFDLSRAICEQITCICGNQRGGKGTLMAIMAVLASAIDPNTKIHYFTAGDDVYPFRCDRLVCRLNFPKLDGTDADRLVAGELYRYLKQMDNGTQGQYRDIILVIDEAVALSDYLDPDQKQWIIRFLLTRANKKGAQIFVVLHGSNLTSWVGAGNTGGFSNTFKSGATFIGCEATSKKISPLRSISVATGRYFIASPDDFSKSIDGGELGTIPEWLKTETNPATGQPDPVRTLLKFFPELEVGHVGAIGLEKKDVIEDIRFKLEALIKETPKEKESPQSETAKKLLEIIQSATKQPISFESIRKSRKWENNSPDKATLLAALDELGTDWIRGCEAEGYYLQD